MNGPYKTHFTGQYEIRCYADGSRFMKKHGANYGLLLTGSEALSLDRIIDVYGRSRLIDVTLYGFAETMKLKIGTVWEARQLDPATCMDEFGLTPAERAELDAGAQRAIDCGDVTIDDLRSEGTTVH